MPISYSILHDPDVLLVSYQGTVTNRDFLGGYKSAYADPRYIPGMPEISDMRRMQIYDIDMNAIQEMITWLAGRECLEGKIIQVGVLVSNELHDGVSRLYRAVSDVYGKEKLKNFADLRSALDWLPIDEADYPKVDTQLSALAGAPG
ncbi:hypothetical protein EOI86_22515 [Hwanghaeella grinnelliae]|uniref:STAS/SEC14 domain-containing protein n=1 Tax=Hwanghaeella grinnelliae TaxID=2500179 RepID=A0A3S2W6U6_9PROT|nr:hypothetical protein [Hwanghaeella grinnelliae]RVU33908.1 hypothetical protein EOI86_22515 [Hwanghaeella grinnelliae]